MQSKTHYRFSKPPAVVVGVCAHGLAVLRALAAGGVPLVAIDADASLPGASTRLATFEQVADINGPGLLDALLDLRSRIDCPGSPVLFLVNDRMVETIGSAVDRLAGGFRLSWAPCAHRLLPLLDKTVVAPWSVRQGLSHPATLTVGSEPEMQRTIDEIGFPCIVKPARPLGGFKTYLPETPEDLRRCVANYRADLPFVVQRYIPGDEQAIFFAALYLDRGKVIARYEGQKLRSYPLGHTTVAQSGRDDEIHRQALRFFERLELSGPVSLEIKRAADGTLWVIEPTVGRTDFWVGLCTANGVNLPLVEYCHQIGAEVPAMCQTDAAVWFNEERDPFGWAWFACQPGWRLRGRGSVYLYFHRDDPRPAFRAALRTATRTTRRMFGWLRRAGRQPASAPGLLAMPEAAGTADTKRRIVAAPSANAGCGASR